MASCFCSSSTSTEEAGRSPFEGSPRTPAASAVRGDEHSLVENFDPAAAVFGLITSAIQPDNFGAAQAAGKTQKQHGAVARAPQRSTIQRLQHYDQIFGQDRLFLARRSGVFVANAGYDGGDMAILAVEGEAAVGLLEFLRSPFIAFQWVIRVTNMRPIQDR